MYFFTSRYLKGGGAVADLVFADSFISVKLSAKIM